MQKLFLFTLVMSLVLAAGSSMAETKNGEKVFDKTENKAIEAVNMRSLAEIAAKDPVENCNSCHKKEGDKDYTLEAEARRVAGHPPVKDNATLKSCFTAGCHGKGTLRTRFGNILHKKHAESQVFQPVFKGNCVSCHQLEKNGNIVLKGVNMGRP